MGIDADWIDERGELLGTVDDSRMLLSRMIRESDLEGTTCLRFLDVAGDAYFNQLQIPTLISELEAVLAKVDTAEKRLHLTSVLKLVREARGKTHTYIRFTGD